jgi:RHS repeat-associated protein
VGVDLAAGGPVTMTYNADGLRRRLETPTEDTPFVWDGQNVLLETDDQGATQASYALAPRRYGDLLSQRRGSDSRFYLFDGLGSTDRLLDEDEAITDSYTYEAFGTARASSGTTANPYRYVGRLGYQFDGATELHYIRARHYCQATGSFVSRDPAQDGPNPYVYSKARPTGVTDPEGLQAWVDDGKPWGQQDITLYHELAEDFLGWALNDPESWKPVDCADFAMTMLVLIASGSRANGDKQLSKRVCLWNKARTRPLRGCYNSSDAFFVQGPGPYLATVKREIAATHLLHDGSTVAIEPDTAKAGDLFLSEVHTRVILRIWTDRQGTRWCTYVATDPDGPLEIHTKEYRDAVMGGGPRRWNFDAWREPTCCKLAGTLWR